MDLNEELRKRHGITKLSSLRHAELTPSMLPAGISHYRGWIYDHTRFTLDQVRAFVYNACLSCVSAAKFYDLPVATGELPPQTHLSVRHSRGMHYSSSAASTMCASTGACPQQEEERTHVASIGTVLERVLVCMPTQSLTPNASMPRVTVASTTSQRLLSLQLAAGFLTSERHSPCRRSAPDRSSKPLPACNSSTWG